MKKTTFSAFCIGLMSLGLATAGFAQERKLFGRAVEQINPVTGHIRCASSEYNKHLEEKNSAINTEAFEQWIAPKVAKINADRAAGRSTNVVVRIPVVVHVIHSGQAVGTQRNISDARVRSQITVLNQDFRRIAGTPGFNTNPVGADMEIEFYLAQTGPDGELTTGIDRVNLGNTLWTESNVENILKPQTSWDPKRYFNIWVCQFGDDLNGVYGYAQFPHQSGLLGLDELGTSATDGLICDWRAFGTSDVAPGTYFSGIDKGRTATHEIGHCFGLRHIWGDNSSCTVNAIDGFQDFCPDTPAASAPHYDCNAVYNTCPSAPGNDMTENYMDYSNDLCFNTFTLDQKNRMQAVIQNSPRRKELPLSLVSNPGQTYAYNGRLTLSNLNKGECSPNVAPTLVLRNTGTTTMTSAVITYNVNGGANASFTWTGSLATNGTANITLPAITGGGGQQVFNASIASINGGNADQYAANDVIQTSFDGTGSYNTANVNLELQLDAYGSETRWAFVNVTTGATVASGGPYSNATTALPAPIMRSIPVSLNNCYKFTITDSQGDGICCSYGSGYYNLKTASGDVIATGGSFTTQDVKTFNVQALGLKDNGLTDFVLYPNPNKGSFNVQFSSTTSNDIEVNVHDLRGRQIFTKSFQNNGIFSENLQLNNVQAGIYMVTVQDGDRKEVKKIVVQ